MIITTNGVFQNLIKTHQFPLKQNILCSYLLNISGVMIDIVFKFERNSNNLLRAHNLITKKITRKVLVLGSIILFPVLHFILSSAFTDDSIKHYIDQLKDLSISSDEESVPFYVSCLFRYH